jgi:hypothetical protein
MYLLCGAGAARHFPALHDFLPPYDWTIAPKPMVLGAFNRKFIKIYTRNDQIYKLSN